ncbi:MAG: hypothetical protein FIA92_16560 [Chloroflexi bacterium]|nr:hypothetical protein [Chloroflexota bacterium]
MTDWREPPRDPDRPTRDEDERDDREPDMSDPEAQRAPGDDSNPGRPGERPPPMQARGRDDEVIEMDAEGAGYEAVGRDNIRQGRVGGVMGTPHAGRGQGQGG